MEERLLKFARLVDAGSFTKAAQAMHLSQPALSTAIQKLERELKAELLVRGKRSLQLTAAGQVAYAAAKELVLRSTNLREQISELTHEQATLRIGMIDSLADTLISHKDIFQQLRSQADVALVIDNSVRLVQALAHDEIDIAFIAKQPGRLPQMLDDRLALGAEPLLVVTHPDTRTSLQGSLETAVLPNFLSYNQQATTQQLVHRALSSQGIEPVPSFYSTSPDILLKLTLAGQGTAALPYPMVAEHLANRTLVCLPAIGVIHRPIVAVVRRSKRLNQALVLLCEAMRRILQLEAQAAADVLS